MWDSEYPWDVRVEKINRALVELGYAVDLVARNRNRDPTYERLEEADVHRLEPFRLLSQRVDGALMFPAFFNPRWSLAIRSVVAERSSMAVLCRDLPLAVPAVRAAQSSRIPMILDMAEDYPGMLEQRRATGNWSALDRVVRNPAAARAVERWVLARADLILVVAEEAAQRLADLGVGRNRLAIVGNTPPLRRLESHVPTYEKRGRSVEFGYLGLVEEQRGIDLLICAFADLVRSGHDFRLRIIGGGVDLPKVRDRVNRLEPSIVERITFTGPLANHLALQQLDLCDVGVSPLWRGSHIDTTIPNKLFDYMAAGLPVITSDCPPSARIVRDSRCGVVFGDRKITELIAAMEELVDWKRRAEMGTNGRKAIAVTFNWEEDCARLNEALSRVLGSALRSSG